jgi:ligand-binding sensor domain-containing protein
LRPSIGRAELISLPAAGWKSFRNISQIISMARSGQTLWLGTRGGGLVRFHVASEQYVVYTASDGLPHNTINDVAVDKTGVVWFATPLGVGSFDGRRWEVFTTANGLPSNFIRAIMVDQNNVKWCGTAQGIARLDGRAWTAFQTTRGWKNNDIYSLAAGIRGVWAGTAEGVNEFDGTQWRTRTKEDGMLGNEARCLVVDGDGNVWTGSEEGVSRFDGMVWTNYSLPDRFQGLPVNAVGIDNIRRVWIATAQGLAMFDGARWAYYTTVHGLPSNEIYSLLPEPTGGLWIGCREGLVLYNGERFEAKALKSSLPNNTVRAVACARGRELVYCGTDQGVMRFLGGKWNSITSAEGLPAESVSSVAVDPAGHVWLGTSQGAIEMSESDWVMRKTDQGWANNYIHCIFIETNGRIWAGTNAGANLYNEGNWKTYRKSDGLVSDTVLAIGQDPSGAMWFGTDSGVSRYDGTNWVSYGKAEGLSEQIVRSIACDAGGRVWLGTQGGGITRYDGRNWTTFTQRDGLGGDYVTSIAIDKEGQVWAATWGGGVAIYDGARWVTFDAAQGLASNYVYSVGIDFRGRKWFGTDSGVSILADAHMEPRAMEAPRPAPAAMRAPEAKAELPIKPAAAPTAPKPVPAQPVPAAKPVAPTPAVGNLIQNGSFELDADGNKAPDGWDGITPDKFEMSGDAKSGAKSLHATNRDGTWIGTWQSVKGVGAGDKIAVACWMKTKDLVKGKEAWHSAKVNIEFKKKDGKSDFVGLGELAGTNDWKRYEKVIDVPAGTDSVGMQICVDSCKGDAWFDGIVVVKGDKVPAEEAPPAVAAPAPAPAGVSLDARKFLAAPGALVVNGGFETGDPVKGPDGWKGWAPETMSFSADTKEGKKSVHIVNKAPAWTGLNQVLTGVAGGEKLAVSCWIKTKNVVKGKDAWNNAKVNFELKKADGKSDWSGLGGIEGTNDWKKYETTITLPPDLKEANMIVCLDACAGEAWFDGLTIAKAPASVPGVSAPASAPVPAKAQAAPPAPAAAEPAPKKAAEPAPTPAATEPAPKKAQEAPPLF